MITIYTDGSSLGNPGPGGWGAVVLYENNNQSWVTELGGQDDHTTNNRMELIAAIKSLEFLSTLGARDEQLEVVIHTDSEYVMKGMTEWIENWQKKGWRTAGRKPVLNQDLWQKLLQLTENKQVDWKYVAGHTGVPLNERADTIATSFALQVNQGGAQPALYHGPKEKYN